MTYLSQKKLQNATNNFPNYIFRFHTLILLAYFFIYFFIEFYTIVWKGKGYHEKSMKRKY